MVRRHAVKKPKISKRTFERQMNSYLLLQAEIKATAEIEKLLFINNTTNTSNAAKFSSDEFQKEFDTFITNYDSVFNK